MLLCPMADPVDPALYSEEYFRGNCGGSEFFDLYGARMLKPVMAYSFARAEIRPGMRVLDVGCGRGEILRHVRQAGAEGVGIDYADAAIAIAAEVSGCAVLKADAKALPFPDASFDRIFFLGVIDHLHDWELEACFAEFKRVLKPGGFVLVHTCTNTLYYKVWSYGLRRLLARGLGKLGLKVRDPRPPRSSEDEALHINEHSAGSLSAFFRRIGWRAEVEPRMNYKLVLRELYPSPLPADFPLKPSCGLGAALYRSLLWRGPLKQVLARELFCRASPEPARRD